VRCGDYVARDDDPRDTAFPVEPARGTSRMWK